MFFNLHNYTRQIYRSVNSLQNDTWYNDFTWNVILLKKMAPSRIISWFSYILCTYQEEIDLWISHNLSIKQPLFYKRRSEFDPDIAVFENQRRTDSAPS